MKDELEEGYFDDAGIYHETKDDEHEGDLWLQGNNVFVPKNGAQSSSAAMEEDEQAVEPEKRTKGTLFAQLLPLMRPGETCAQSLRRLGGGCGATRKWQGQKKKAEPAMVEEADPAKVAEMTALTDELMGIGEYEVYSATYEKVSIKKTFSPLRAVVFGVVPCI